MAPRTRRVSASISVTVPDTLLATNRTGVVAAGCAAARGSPAPPPRTSASAASARAATIALARVLHRPRLADHRDLYLSGVLQLALDLAGDLVREQHSLVVVDVVWLDHDADLPARLHGIDLLDAGVAGG